MRRKSGVRSKKKKKGEARKKLLFRREGVRGSSCMCVCVMDMHACTHAHTRARTHIHGDLTLHCRKAGLSYRRSRLLSIKSS